MDALRLKSKFFASMARHGVTGIELRCYCDFEGHGQASETFEIHWTLKFPHIQAYWKGTGGWIMSKPGIPLGFHGKSAGDVIKKSLEFFEAVPDFEVLHK